MTEYDQKTVYELIANSIIDTAIDLAWERGELEIEIDHNYFGYKCFFFITNGERISIRFKKREGLSEAVKWLHTFTSSMGNTKWNRAHFTIDNSGKYEIQFIWDQEIQDKVDAINKTRK